MKRKLITIISIIFMIMSFGIVNADEDITNLDAEMDMKQWNYKMLTGKSDQDENIKVNMYYSMLDNNKHAFCIEPNQSYRPKHAIYYQDSLDNDYYYELVKAYEKIGLEDNNYYIATQLLIWEDINQTEYTFDGYGYEDYKKEILDFAFGKTLLKSSFVSSSEPSIQAYVNEVNVIEDDFSQYEVSAEGIEILSNDEEGLKYVVKQEEPLIKTIDFQPLDTDEKHKIVARSTDSQDIYYFDGEYSNLKPFNLSLMTLSRPSTMSINYSKKDSEGRNIEGAEFSVYRINDEESDDQLVFIQNNVEVNIYEALLDDPGLYENLRIETSERYDRYIYENLINTDEIGYFPYKIYSNNNLIKQGICYVSEDINQTNGTYAKYDIRRIFKGFSEDLDVNTINDLPTNSSYFLCESEPKKGYIYASNPCVLLNTDEYKGETFEFINSTRKYNLKLIKQSPDNIPLDGAIFNMKYIENGVEKSIDFSTGSLMIPRNENSEYIIYKYEKDNDICIAKFSNDTFILDNPLEGRYYFYQSNSPIINDSLLNKDYVDVVKGGFCIDNLPYSSSLTLQELKPPKGFMLDENPIYHIDPNIPYSEITFKNYRVNNIDIIPEKKFIIPLTCVN